MTSPVLLALLLAAEPGEQPSGPAPASPGGAEVGDADASPAAAPDAPPSLSFRGRLEWITAAGGASTRATPADPGNRILELPAAGAQSELRPDLRLEYGAALTAVVRPRVLLKAERARTDEGWQAERTDASSEWIEAYATWRVDDTLALSYGLQNFQWGPAELVSPSNRIFHATGFYRDPLYVVRGRHLARVNVSAGRDLSAVLLAEVAGNGEAPFVAGEPFDPKAQAKLEYTARGGDAYVAVTAGASRRSRAWFGEYGAVPIAAGLSAYADAVHTVGRRAWYPVSDPLLGPTFAQIGMDTRALRTTALGGVRYSFRGGTDVRLEYVFDEAGWDEERLALAARAAAADPRLLAPYLDPGFELLGRHLAYASLLVPDLPPHERTTLQARYLLSLTDGSGVAFVTASWAATDSVVAFASASATHGDAEGALSRLTRANAALGVTVSW